MLAEITGVLRNMQQRAYFLICTGMSINPVNTSILREAIEKKQVLQFTFKGFQRIAEPHAYGIKNRKRMLLVYQIAGGTTSGSVPDWRLIPIDEIGNLVKTGQTFDNAREPPSGDYEKWDTLISKSK